MIFNKEEEREKQQRMMHNMLSITICLVLISMVSLLGLFFNSYIIGAATTESGLITENITYDLSPSFPMQERLDSIGDWINMTTTRPTTDGDRSTDIETINFYSDGSTLNAILWTFFPGESSPSYENVDYGMFINSDFNDNTGLDGIDYNVEISWDNRTQTWTKVVQKLSFDGDYILLDNKTIPFTEFSSTTNHFVLLSADLDTLLSPKKYKVVFYSGFRDGSGNYITDFISYIPIPPLELTITTSPSSVQLRPGDTKTIAIQVNASIGYEPTIELLAIERSDNLTIKLSSGTFRVPSSGSISVPLILTAPNNITSGPYTLLISANATFPEDEFTTTEFEGRSFLIPTSMSMENALTESTFVAMVLEPLTFLDRLGLGSPENAISLNIPQEYLVGFYIVVLSFLIPAIVRWFNRRRQGKQLAYIMTTINGIYDMSDQNKDESTRSLEWVRRQISITYAAGKISETDYKILNEKISEYEGKIKGSLKGPQSS